MKVIKMMRVSGVPQSLNLLLKGQLRFLIKYFDVVGVSSSGRLLDELAVREGVKVFPLEIERRISLRKDFVSLIKLYLLFRTERPDIVHSITPKAGLLSMVAARLAGVPIRLHTFTGLIFPSRKGPLRALLIAMDRILCLCATRVYPEGQGVKNDLIKFRITNKPLRVLANGNVNGVDVTHYDVDALPLGHILDLKQALGYRDEHFVFIYIGRLVSEKGVNELVHAFAALVTIRPNARLLVVGDFEDHIDPITSETCALLTSMETIKYVGYQADVRPYLAVSNVLVLPSYREGFPNVVLQAGSMGLPCIVTDINGSNEIITHGVNGLIVQPRTVGALREAMLTVLDNPELYRKMKDTSRLSIVSRFRQELVWDALLKEYIELLGMDCCSHGCAGRGTRSAAEQNV